MHLSNNNEQNLLEDIPRPLLFMIKTHCPYDKYVQVKRNLELQSHHFTKEINKHNKKNKRQIDKLYWTIEGFKVYSKNYLKKNPKIIKYIHNISFPQLKQLELSGNDITSMEEFCRVNAPQLRNINLSQNRIVSVASLRKCSVVLINRFSIFQNPVVNIPALNELNSPFFRYFALEDKPSNSEINPDINWLAKFLTVMSLSHKGGISKKCHIYLNSKCRIQADKDCSITRKNLSILAKIAQKIQFRKSKAILPSFLIGIQVQSSSESD